MMACDSDMNLNCAGEGQFASSYGQGGGLGRRDENDYRVELTPGWRWCRNNKQYLIILNFQTDQALEMFLWAAQI